jgi:23S rRNA (adenine2503-C2)-methyltransferase
MSEKKKQLTGLGLEELSAFIKALGFPAFRAGQLMGWLVKGADYQEMRNLPASMISQLKETAVAQPAAILERHVSKTDGTEKYLFSLTDGHCVEGVLMRYKHGITLCLSTQVGCLMGCAFCASTLDGKLRDLTAGEMLSMAYLANRLAGLEHISNIVLMGSGEPLDNYDQVIHFLRQVSSPENLNIGLRHISLSTCGLPDKIRQLADEKLPVTLSVSLHAPNDEIRRQIMPVARAHPIGRLMEACRYYLDKTGRRLVFEYALIHGVNAEPAHAIELAKRLRGMQCHVNLIPLNDVPERELKTATKAEVRQFSQELERQGISATLRRQLGDDIIGACGQLRAQRLKTPLVPKEGAV